MLCLWVAWPSSFVLRATVNDPHQKERWDYLIFLMPLYASLRLKSKWWIVPMLIYVGCIVWFFWFSESTRRLFW